MANKHIYVSIAKKAEQENGKKNPKCSFKAPFQLSPGYCCTP